MSTSPGAPNSTNSSENQNAQGGLNVTSRALIFLSIVALLATLYLAKQVVLPIFVAAFIALFASPLVALLVKIHLPRAVAAAAVVAAILGSFIGIGSLLVEPASRWLKTMPEMFEGVAASLAQSPNPVPQQPEGSDLGNTYSVAKAMDETLSSLTALAAETSILALMQMASVVIITYFFLTYGEQLMRNIVRARDSFSDKKLTVVIFHTIRDDVSTYVLLVSLINLGLGLATAGVLALIGFEDPLLWGALATVLNYAPYVGPLVLAVILTLVGFATGNTLEQSLVAPGAFLTLNLIESQFVTPTVFGRRFNINPLLVVLWMLIWGWIWGAMGMLLAIPMLMCLKITGSHLDWVGDWVTVLDGPASTTEAVEVTHKRNPVFEIITKKLNQITKNRLYNE